MDLTGFIEKLILQKDYKLAIKKVESINTNPDPIKYTAIYYFSKISENIASIINTFTEYKTTFKTNNNILTKLFNAKDRTNNFLKSGIYKLNCLHCIFVYIGQTIRNFDIRYKEHVHCYKYKYTDKSNYAKHLLDNNHYMTLNNNIFTFLRQ